MSGRTGKVTATIVGISTVCVIAFASTGFWQDILVQFHLYWLRSEPEYLKDIVTAEEKSPQPTLV